MKDDAFRKWIVAYTKPRHEKSVENELRKKGLEVYLPLIKKRRNWSDRKKWVDYPLFKSYLFIKTELNNIIFVVQTPGLVKIIKFGNEIAVVDDLSIKSIKIMLNGGYTPKITDYFIKGDLVKVKEGPLKGITGEVTRIDGNDRLIIKIDAIQHSVSIKIKRSFLKILK